MENNYAMKINQLTTRLLNIEENVSTIPPDELPSTSRGLGIRNFSESKTKNEVDQQAIGSNICEKADNYETKIKHITTRLLRNIEQNTSNISEGEVPSTSRRLGIKNNSASKSKTEQVTSRNTGQKTAPNSNWRKRNSKTKVLEQNPNNRELDAPNQREIVLPKAIPNRNWRKRNSKAKVLEQNPNSKELDLPNQREMDLPKVPKTIRTNDCIMIPSLQSIPLIDRETILKNKFPKPTRNSTANREFVIGIKFLQQTLDKEPTTILQVLQEKKEEFKKFYNASMKPDMMVLAIKILSKIGSTGFLNLEIDFFSFICNSNFIKSLQEFILNLSLQHVSKQHQNKFYYEDVKSFWTSITTIFNNLIILLPNTVCQKLYEVVQACKITLTNLHYQHKVDDSITEEYETFYKKFNFAFEEQERKKAIVNLTSDKEYEEPPDDFRSMNVYPGPGDILSNEKVFLRPNIIRGAYVSVEHYLDVQFRLLREDFISPLREGVQDLLNINETKKKRKLSIRVYKKTKFLNSHISKDAIGILVDFKVDKRQPDGTLKDNYINWEQSKRFLFGSLLCFTSDKFKSIIFATVVERDVKMLKNGHLLIQLCDEFSHLEHDLFDDTIYWMIESEVYFEPYLHVLRALKSIGEHNFPMQKYLINVQCESTRPTYLTGDMSYIHNMISIPVTEFEKWPIAENLELNDSQYKAVQLALTNQFSVIQGPPGTGKTYVGLKIASILIENLKQKQMLVVCYTNHALDQFLEGLIPFTQNIVRVGNRSKNESLNKFNLSKIRRPQRHCYGLRIELRQAIDDLKRKTHNLDILSKNECIINDVDCIVFPDYFREKCQKLPYTKLVYWLLEIDENEVKNLNIDVISKLMAGNEYDMEEVIDDNTDEINELFNPYREDDNLMQEIGDLFEKCHITTDLEYSISKTGLYNTLKTLQKEIDKADNEQLVLALSYEYNNILLLYKKLTEYLHDFANGKIGNIKDVRGILARKVFNCSKEEKWSLYRFFLNKIKAKIQHDITILTKEIRSLRSNLDELRHIEDLEVLQTAHVIGMTTTCAARLQSSLKRLKIPLVIIEEAAEVPESHIIISLTEHCQHLILIGDHLQLKPSTSAFKLAKHFNLDISLFERMINNNMHCVQLNVQHRMRPEIASLICPNIYKELQNHESVLYFPKVVGVVNSLFFIKHNVFEDKMSNEDTKRNSFEAALIIRLCRYLCLQGYETEKITILTTYLGQMFLIKNNMKGDKILEGVKVTVVDNFQGEENDIILLSLVRSNEESNIGFLKTKNRVCVALSRAKIGFYIIGNMDNLVENNEIWPKINDSLQKINSIGTHLTLQCQIHIDEFTTVSCAEDFDKVPEGGCRRICRSLIACGHYCNSICHVIDREHIKYKCKEPCAKLCKRNHACKNLCFQTCSFCNIKVSKELKCGHTADMPCGLKREEYNCEEIVKAILPECKHEVEKQCYRDPAKFPCTFPCVNRLECGHQCELKCHVNDDPDHINYKCSKPCPKYYKGCKNNHPCEKQCFESCPPCSIKVKKMYTKCNHYEIVDCSKDIDGIDCKMPCKRTLGCGHHCKLKCYQPCGNCTVKVQKQIPECGHTIRMNCSDDADISKCHNKCIKKLPCGHDCTKKCCEQCTVLCKVIVKSKFMSPCGHFAYVPCHMLSMPDELQNSDEFLNNCQERCNENLKCGHKCAGTCSECLQGRIHIPCQEKCGNKLICQHSCKVPCREYCPPCNEPCTYQCIHSKCPKKCGEPCATCKEKCTWVCEHKNCSKRCGDICDREPCNEPCKKKLDCKHDCVGLCGEPCPPLCRICNEEELTSIFFGNEDEDDARFVVLEECGHVFESSGLDNWFSVPTASQEISAKQCPKCTTVVNKTQRYATACKIAYQSIIKCKEKLYGTPEQNNKRAEVLRTKIANLINESMRFCKESQPWKNMINYLNKHTQKSHKGRKLNLNMTMVSKLETIYGKMSEILKLYNKIENNTSEEKIFIKYCDFILKSLTKAEYSISEQLAIDIDYEQSRLHWINQLCQICDKEEYKRYINDVRVIRAYKECIQSITCLQKFTNEKSKFAKVCINNLLELLNTKFTVSEEEKRMIVSAMGLKQGHWYECPNGHTYCITECGGAMQQSKCPECREVIGGSNHRLNERNRVATHMDGATRPAWPQ